MKYITSIGEREYIIEILDDGMITINAEALRVDFQEIGAGRVYSLLIEGRSVEAYIYPAQHGWQVLLNGRIYPARVEDEREHRLRSSIGDERQEGGEIALKAPMPGLVVAVQVSDGQNVDKGEVLIVLESMKMQNELKAPRGGQVTRIRVSSGDRVEQHDTLLILV